MKLKLNEIALFSTMAEYALVQCQSKLRMSRGKERDVDSKVRQKLWQAGPSGTVWSAKWTVGSKFIKSQW